MFSSGDTDLDELIRRADLAMYTAKRSGGRQHVLYDAGLEDLDPAAVLTEDAASETDPTPAA